MDALSKYESWVACTIITNAVQREHSNREPAREDCGALRIPDSSAGLNINAIPAANDPPPVLTGLNVVATARVSMHPMRPIHGPRFELIERTLIMTGLSE